MAAPGTYRDPSTRGCWETCTACGRCSKKGTSACPLPNSCSGRFDMNGKIDPHLDDFCQCTQGVLRWRTQEGRVIITKYGRNPFRGSIQRESKTEDERDWDSYVADMQEKLDNPNWNPIKVYNE